MALVHNGLRKGITFSIILMSWIIWILDARFWYISHLSTENCVFYEFKANIDDSSIRAATLSNKGSGKNRQCSAVPWANAEDSFSSTDSTHYLNFWYAFNICKGKGTNSITFYYSIIIKYEITPLSWSALQAVQGLECCFNKFPVKTDNQLGLTNCSFISWGEGVVLLKG